MKAKTPTAGLVTNMQASNVTSLTSNLILTNIYKLLTVADECCRSHNRKKDGRRIIKLQRGDLEIIPQR